MKALLASSLDEVLQFSRLLMNSLEMNCAVPESRPAAEGERCMAMSVEFVVHSVKASGGVQEAGEAALWNIDWRPPIGVEAAATAAAEVKAVGASSGMEAAILTERRKTEASKSVGTAQITADSNRDETTLLTIELEKPAMVAGVASTLKNLNIRPK